MTIVVLTSILAVAALMLGGAVATLTLLAVLPLVAGTVLITRPSAADWFQTGEAL
jgi:hypothetical protein